MQKVSLQQQAVELIEQLSTEKLKAVVDYLNYLQDKEAWEATHELASDPEVEGFEGRNGVRLPKDIAAMLTLPQ